MHFKQLTRNFQHSQRIVQSLARRNSIKSYYNWSRRPLELDETTDGNKTLGFSFAIHVISRRCYSLNKLQIVTQNSNAEQHQLNLITIDRGNRWNLMKQQTVTKPLVFVSQFTSSPEATPSTSCKLRHKTQTQNNTNQVVSRAQINEWNTLFVSLLVTLKNIWTKY